MKTENVLIVAIISLGILYFFKIESLGSFLLIAGFFYLFYFLPILYVKRFNERIFKK